MRELFFISLMAATVAVGALVYTERELMVRCNSPLPAATLDTMEGMEEHDLQVRRRVLGRGLQVCDHNGVHRYYVVGRDAHPDVRADLEARRARELHAAWKIYAATHAARSARAARNNH